MADTRISAARAFTTCRPTRSAPSTGSSPAASKGLPGLVYLHRYNEGTLARMRTEYVIPLPAKMVSRLDMLDQDACRQHRRRPPAPSCRRQIEPAARSSRSNCSPTTRKLRHYADMRITLDLDDGVKVNYGKFGDLLAEAKAITGGSDE